MKTLLHVCCAPCSVQCIEQLQKEEIETVCFWYNPNIHPYTEYRSRKNTLIEYTQGLGVKLVLYDEYGLHKFIRGVSHDLNDRCGFCYADRLSATAKYALENGYDSFTTTLLISPYQRHELICETGERLGNKYGVPFLYRDFRPFFKKGQAQAREMGLYMQKYCGCIFSEEERYRKNKAGKEAGEAAIKILG